MILAEYDRYGLIEFAPANPTNAATGDYDTIWNMISIADTYIICDRGLMRHRIILSMLRIIIYSDKTGIYRDYVVTISRYR